MSVMPWRTVITPMASTVKLALAGKRKLPRMAAAMPMPTIQRPSRV